ncbi:hypothetical protein [Lacrimispora sp. 210928-DFI.3.58]|nr:hypothetical protein [Lacrimispora sp. 210928-DFI.3.58]MCB7320911.1 hypothetical protein [Lacrimispora sp. 210928-DFI.3.58]
MVGSLLSWEGYATPLQAVKESLINAANKKAKIRFIGYLHVFLDVLSFC